MRRHVVQTVLHKLLLMACVLVPSTSSLAQRRPTPATDSKLTLRNIGMAKVSLSKGRLHRTIDLSEEVVGCRYVSGAWKATLRKRGCAAFPASFKLIDSTTQDGKTYLIVLSEAADNCNVCARCGASEAFTLIWLELDATLVVRNKKSVAIQDCMAFIETVEPETEVKEPADQDEVSLPFKNDVLRVTFERRLFAESGNKQNYRLSHLEYDRKQPGRGLIITTEARDKSAQESPQ